jgi:ubiquitin-like protein Nedd8
MLIKVKTVTNRDLEITTCELNNTIGQLKEAIEQNEGIPVINQRLIFNGKPLDDETIIEAANIAAGDTVHMVLALRAGAF